MHRAAVQRFWSLFNSEEGAVLCSLTSDVAAAFEGVARGDSRPLILASPDQNDRGLVMRAAPTFRRENIPAPPSLRVQSATAPTALPAEAVPPPKAPEPPASPTISKPPVPRLPEPTVLREVVTPAPVFLDVTVIDRANHPVVDLGKPDFSVFEDGVRQETALFTRERMPISLVVLIDTSGSISAKLGRIRASASSIVRQGHPQDEFCIVQFTGDATVVQDFTTNVASLEQALSRLKAGGETALLDAVKFAAQYANERGQHDRKGVIVVTDGGEANSRCSRDEVLAALRAANTRLYSVAFPDGLDQSQSPNAHGFGATKPREAESRARNLLDELARVSGGRAFYPQQAMELDEIAESIALELRTQYRLGYRPTHVDRDGGWRDVRVDVIPNQGRDGMGARTRAGYFAPKSP